MKLFLIFALQALLLQPLLADETMAIRRHYAQELSTKFSQAVDVSTIALLKSLDGREFFCTYVVNDVNYKNDVTLAHRTFKVSGKRLSLDGLNYHSNGPFILEQNQLMRNFQSDDGELQYADQLRIINDHELIFEMSCSKQLGTPALKQRSKASGMPVLSWNHCRERGF